MRALAGSQDVFEDFFTSARIGLALADLSGRFVRVNATYAELVGVAPEDLVGVELAEVLALPDEGAWERLLAGQGPGVQVEREHPRTDGGTCWVLHGVAPVAGAGGGPAWLAVSAQDITERRRAEQELRALTDALAEQAARDPLTGLANRGQLEERAGAALSRDERTGGSSGVLFLDLDGFKAVNDRYGHAVGDAVLQAVAQRLRAAVRPADTVARLGGDEFVVLVEGATDEGLVALRDRLERDVAAPLHVGGRTLDVGLSVGVARVTGGAGGVAALLAAADARMYAAKRRGR